MNVYDKIKTLGISLPPLTLPVAAFVPFIRIGNLIFVSGHIAKKGGKAWSGQLGSNVSVDQGKEAGRAVAIDLLGTLHAATGDLSRIKRIVKLMVLVNSAPSFTEQHIVANGVSELFVQVFGDAGAHARSAFGVTQVPFGSCLEVEAIAEVE